jgi:hypothetical protein
MEVIQDINEANRCIRELIALSLLPSIWSGGQEEQIRENLADALQSSLRAEIVLVRGRNTDGQLQADRTIRLKRFNQQEALLKNLEGAIENALLGQVEDSSEICVDGIKVRLAVMTLGVTAEFGLLAIGQRVRTFQYRQRGFCWMWR